MYENSCTRSRAVTDTVYTHVTRTVGIYRGADKSLARPISRCNLMVKIFRLMLVVFHIYSVIPRLTSDPANEFFG